MGLSMFGQREIAYYSDDKKKMSEVFYNVFIMKLFLSLLFTLLYIIFVVVFCRNDFLMYICMVFGLLAVTVDVTWLYQGLEEFGIIVFRNILFKILNIVFIFTLIKSKADVTLYLFGIFFFTFISNITLWFNLKKFILPINIKSVKLFKNFNEAITLFLPTIAIQIYTVLDKTMLGLIAKNSFENGYYEQAIKIPKVLLAIVTAVSTIAIPRVSYYFNKKDNDSVNKLMYKSYRFVWFLAIPMSLGLFILSDNFVPWFFGVDFIKVSILLKLLSFLIIAIGFSNITGRLFMISAKLQNKLTISLSIGAAINVLLKGTSIKS